MITENKKLRLTFLITSLLYFIAILTCFICDIAINKSIGWSAYPLGGIVFVWTMTSVLLLAKRNRVFFSLVDLTIFTIPLLYYVEYIAPFKGWFFGIALPISVATIIALWITYALLKFCKINKWYLSAIIVFIFGVVVDFFAEYFIANFLETDLFSFSNIINIVGAIVITALLCVVGYYNSINKDLKEEIRLQ